MAYASDIQNANNGITDRFAALIKNLGARYARYKCFRSTLNELATLSNADLRDLGMCRAQIRSVAWEARLRRALKFLFGNPSPPPWDFWNSGDISPPP